MEFDYPDSKLRFFKTKGCVGDQVVYWGKAYTVTPIVRTDGDDEVDVTVRLNDVAVQAELDSGSGSSVVTTGAAARAGVTPTSAGVTAVGQSTGVGAQAVDTYIGIFKTFSFGDETIRNAKLSIADLFGADKEVHLGSRIATPVEMGHPQMLLGADFLRSHRVYVSKSQGQVYVSYVGGPVFDTSHSASTPAGAGIPAPADH